MKYVFMERQRRSNIDRRSNSLLRKMTSIQNINCFKTSNHKVSNISSDDGNDNYGGNNDDKC